MQILGYSASELRRIVRWKASIFYNLQRAVAAGAVWTVLGFVFEMEGPAAFLLGVPILYLVFLLPIGLVASLLGRWIPFVGLISVFCALIIAVGDPVIYGLSKLQPRWVPVGPPVLQLRLFVVVLDDSLLTDAVGRARESISLQQLVSRKKQGPVI